MNPEDVVLVVLLNRGRDFDLVVREHWYRIPVRHAPRYFSGAQVLAFYLSGVFGESKWTVPQFALVRGHELVRRRDLLPDEQDHPRADDLYYKLQLGPLERREPPIVSKRARRMLFLWTTWERFANAVEFNDLVHRGPIHDRLWEALMAENLDADREILVREGRLRYRVDFMIYCPHGRVAVTIGPQPARQASTRRLRSVAISKEELENDFDRALERIRLQAAELAAHCASREAMA